MFTNTKKVSILTSLVIAVSVVAVWPSLANGQAKTHPVFVTLDNVQEVVGNAVAGFQEQLDALSNRLLANEATDQTQNQSIDTLEQQLTEANDLITSQSTQLTELTQTVAGYEERISHLEEVAHEKTPAGETTFLQGILGDSEQSLAYDLSDYEVVTFQADLLSSEGNFIVFRNDVSRGWVAVANISNVSDETPTSQTMLLEDGEYRVQFINTGDTRAIGSLTAIHY